MCQAFRGSAKGRGVMCTAGWSHASWPGLSPSRSNSLVHSECACAVDVLRAVSWGTRELLPAPLIFSSVCHGHADKIILSMCSPVENSCDLRLCV